MPKMQEIQEIREGYEIIIMRINNIANSCWGISFTKLCLVNPTVTEMVDTLCKLVDILDKLSVDQDDLSVVYAEFRVREYLADIRSIANAINNREEGEFNRLLRDIRRRPYT